MVEVAQPREVLLDAKGISKRFGPQDALSDVDLQVARGEVHALVGENGAGKSTLIKVLAGAIAPDAGSLTFAGRSFAPRDPLAARRAGIAVIYQELSLAPDLSVQDNVMLGREQHRAGFLQRGAMRARVLDALALLEHAGITPERKLATLGAAARQLVEVVRALVSDAQLVIMDEPTSSLGQADVARLFAVIARLRARGVSVIYISHALEELAVVADRYTVLRDGKRVKSGAMADTTRGELIEAMVGRTLDEAFPNVRHQPGELLLELDRLSGTRLPRDASLQLRRGEILGIAGLVGAGRSELLRALFGLEPIASGTVKLSGKLAGELSHGADSGRPPWIRLAQGVGLLSEQRKEEGIALGLSVVDNLTLAALGRTARAGWLDRGAQRSAAQRWITSLGVRVRDPLAPIAALSGGNQQKVALARLLHCDADVLLLDEPTRGIDVGSKAEIYRSIGELAARGKAVLLCSSYLPELLGVCDRIAVMHRGRLGAARDAAELTEAALMQEATGAVDDVERAPAGAAADA
jgi:ribose transport system ATP-binding protein